MNISKLYYSILNKPFFIDMRRIEERATLIDALLTHKMAADFEEKGKLEAKVAASGGTAVSGTFDKAPEDSVAVIPLVGDMLKYDTFCAYGTESIAALMREAADSDRITGIVLSIDSGGGAVDAVPPMLQAIDYARASGKSVVASCDLCASAAYYVACHCDEIVADNDISSEFGSIGVMVQFRDYAKYYEKEGIKTHTIYSNLSDYKNAPFEAALKGDYKAIKKEMLDPMARKFQEAVKSHRPDLKTDTEGILSGRMFYAQSAVEVGLIDKVGTFDTAVADARRLSADIKLKAYTGSMK